MADADAPAGPGDGSSDAQAAAGRRRLPWQIVAGLLMLVWGIRWLTDPMLRTAVWLLLYAGNAAAWSAAGAPLVLYCALQAANLGLAIWTMVTGVRLLRYPSAAPAAVRILLRRSAGVRSVGAPGDGVLAVGGDRSGRAQAAGPGRDPLTMAAEIGAAVPSCSSGADDTEAHEHRGFACRSGLARRSGRGRGSLGALQSSVPARTWSRCRWPPLALPSALLALGTTSSRPTCPGS